MRKHEAVGGGGGDEVVGQAGDFEIVYRQAVGVFLANARNDRDMTLIGLEQPVARTQQLGVLPAVTVNPKRMLVGRFDPLTLCLGTAEPRGRGQERIGFTRIALVATRTAPECDARREGLWFKIEPLP